MTHNQIFKFAAALLISSALSGCKLASLAGIKDPDGGGVVVAPLKTVRVGTISDAMTVWYPGKTIAEIKLLLIQDLGITAEVADSYVSQASLNAKLVWYDKGRKVVGPAYWHPTEGRILAVNEDGDPFNDAGVGYLTATNAPQCLPNCTNVPLVGVGVNSTLVALHTAAYKGTGLINSKVMDAAGKIVETDERTLAVNLAANFDEGTVKGSATFKAGDQKKDTATIALNDANIRGVGFTGTTTVSTGESGTFANQSGVYGGQFAADGSEVSGSGNGTVGGLKSDIGGLQSAAYDFDFNADKVKVVDPAMAVRPITAGDIIARVYPGKTFAQAKALMILEAVRDGDTQANAEKFATKVNETTPWVGYDNSGKEVGPVYFDPKTNSIVRNSRDGDPSNDASVENGFRGFVPECVPNCPFGPDNLSAVASELVAKHLATYTGTGEYKIDVKDSNSRDYTAATTDTLTANFDNGTIGGKSVHKEFGRNTGDTITLLLGGGIIQGRSFDGNINSVDNQGGSILNQDENSKFEGAFSPDGTSASGTGSGIISGTIPGSNETWSGDYKLKFNVTEKK